MRNLILATLSLLGILFIVLGSVGRLGIPKPKVTAPDPRYSAPAISSSVVRDVQDFTVLISDESMDGIGRGTGILLNPTTVLTCAHMLSKEHSTRDMWIYPYPGAQVVHAKLKFVNHSKDLALLELTTPVTGHKTPVFASKVLVGEPILVVGNIHGYMIWFASYGIISGEHDRWVLTDATIRGGNSGGPWVNMKGEIVALTDVGWEDDDKNGMSISGGVPVQDLKTFLAQAKMKKPDVIYALTGN